MKNRGKAEETSNVNERYPELMFSWRFPEDFEIERNGKIYKNIWEIREFDSDKIYRFSFISPDCSYPLNETKFPNRSRYHSRA